MNPAAYWTIILAFVIFFFWTNLYMSNGNLSDKSCCLCSYKLGLIIILITLLFMIHSFALLEALLQKSLLGSVVPFTSYSLIVHVSSRYWRVILRTISWFQFSSIVMFLGLSFSEAIYWTLVFEVHICHLCKAQLFGNY